MNCGSWWAQQRDGLQWHHNECDGISNHWHPDCLLNHLFRCRSKKTSKLHITGFCEGNPLVTSGSGTWRSWCHQMETFSALLAICVGNSPVPGEFLAQRSVTRSFDVFFDQRLDKQLSKQSWGLWFETQSRPLWCHHNESNPLVPELQMNYCHLTGW